MSLAMWPLQRALVRSLRNPRLVRHLHRSAVWASKKVVQPFKLADIGEGITECEVIKWSVKPNDTVEAFDPLCEVQSDKASVEITSPFEGLVKELLVKEGEVAKVGSNLCLIEVVREDDADVEDAHSEQPQAQTSAQTVQSSPEQGETSPPATPKLRKPHPLDPNVSQRKDSNLSSDVLALPSVRHFAKSKGVDLALLTPGSGRNGRVEKKDIEAYLSRSPGFAITPEHTSDKAAQSGEDAVIELGRTRYGMWKAMEKSLEIPHFGYSTFLDLTKLHEILPLLNANIPLHYLLSPPLPKPLLVNPSAVYPAPSPPDVLDTARYTRLTFLPVMLKTLSRAMQEWPLFRASITATTNDAAQSKPTLTVRSHADICIALSTPTGLYTPTIQRVDTHSVYSIASQIAHLSALGRKVPSGLTPKEMPRRGGTLTVSNVGAIGDGVFASPVLVPGGGVAIVAIGRAKWVRDEERNGERRLKVGVSWSADHRVVEGAELAAFVECWRSWLENPERLVADSV